MQYDSIQIRWKDTGKKNNDVKYRNKIIKRYNGGWIITGMKKHDRNIYHCIECAENAIDQQLTGKTRRNAPKRKEHGIHIIGEMDGEE